MNTKYAFKNTYDEFKADNIMNNLDDTNSGISEEFRLKLEKFTHVKKKLLNTKMFEEIFSGDSVYSGSGGLALYYLMVAMKNKDNPDILKTALDYLDIDNIKGRRISFLCGDAGPLAIATIISYKLGDQRHTEKIPSYKTIAERLFSLSSLIKSSPDEILYGKSGYLYALLFVKKHVPEHDLVPVALIIKVITSILNSGKQFSKVMSSDSPLLWQWHDKIYFGAAHGMAGILYMLLQARKYIDSTDMSNYIRPTIDWLLEQRFQSGNFPSSMGSPQKDKLVQWCHGAPGFVALCNLAAKTFDNKKYLSISETACDVIWERGICTKGYSLCHGVSGNAYAFIQMYQTTKNPIHLYRACCFMEWCVEEREGTEQHHPDRPASLFEGLVGRLYLATDVISVSSAKFPGYTI